MEQERYRARPLVLVDGPRWLVSVEDSLLVQKLAKIEHAISNKVVGNFRGFGHAVTHSFEGRCHASQL